MRAQSWRRSGCRAFPRASGPRCLTCSSSRRPARRCCRRWSRAAPVITSRLSALLRPVSALSQLSHQHRAQGTAAAAERSGQGVGSLHSNSTTACPWLSQAHGRAKYIHGLPRRARYSQAPVDGAGGAGRAPAQRRGARDRRRRRHRRGAPGGALRRPRQHGCPGAPGKQDLACRRPISHLWLWPGITAHILAPCHAG